MKEETDSLKEAAHDQAISGNYFTNKIFMEEAGCKCLLCNQHKETLE
jgi:hypothetical protein